MPRAKELKIRVDNRPGMLGEVAAALAEQKVNVRAVNAWVESGQGVIRLVVDKLPVARKVLTRRGWSPEEEEVLEVELADKAGTLAALATALGKAGIDIRHIYVGTAGARKATVFMGVSDLAGALKAARTAR